MKRRSLIILSLVLLLGLASAAAAASIWLAPGWNASSTSVILQRLEAVFRKDTLNTAEAVSQFLFPYDFFEPDTDFRRWRSLTPQELQELSAKEKQTRDLVLFAGRLGIASLQTRQFFVVTARATAGMDFGTVPINAYLNEQSGKLTVRLPPISVTDFAIVDEPALGFPEFPLSPSLWRETILLLKPHIQEAMTESGLLETARKNAEFQLKLLTEVLGISDVDFIFGTP